MKNLLSVNIAVPADSDAREITLLWDDHCSEAEVDSIQSAPTVRIEISFTAQENCPFAFPESIYRRNLFSHIFGLLPAIHPTSVLIARPATWDVGRVTLSGRFRDRAAQPDPLDLLMTRTVAVDVQCPFVYHVKK